MIPAVLIEWVMARAVKLAGVGVGVSVLIGSCVMVEHKGVKKERARVSAEAMKTDAKATPARRAAERDPAGVLKRYLRD